MPVQPTSNLATPHSSAADPGAGEGRRAKQRRELLGAIDHEARRLLIEGGPANVSIRAIARAVGIGAASLYTYFDSLDEVFTSLLLSSYGRLAAATAAAVDHFADASPADRALAGILALRRWALDHRHEFNLIFSDQLPGYSAPPGGPTVDAQVAVFRPITDAIAAVSMGAARSRDRLGRDEAGLVVWSTFHGAVSLEVNHHLDWLPDAAAFHERAVRAAIASVGLPVPSTNVRKKFDRWWAVSGLSGGTAHGG